MKGKVYLVGSGPGNPGLMTLRAVEVLKEADTIVFDRLINLQILNFAKTDAKYIDVGKNPGGHLVPQEEINQILAREALKGGLVVRLKGGDPFVFGRGGEEAIFLKERGIPFEIIPGITSSIAVPAYAGIPVTHRGMASSFHVITGHEAQGKEREAIDFKVLSKLTGTLIFLMGIKNLPYIVENLIKHGKSLNTPCAIIMEGVTAFQKTVLGSLSDICSKAKEHGITNPAVIIIGEVVSLREQLRWYDDKELFGRRIILTGIHNGNAKDFNTFKILQEKGAEVVCCPTLKITPRLDLVGEFIDSMEAYDVLAFTSKNGAQAFGKTMWSRKLDGRRLQGKEIWAVGPKTSEELQRIFIYPDKMPKEYTAKAMSEIVTQGDRGKKVAIITSDIGGQELLKGLKDAGLQAEKIIAYENTVNLGIKDRILSEIEKGIDVLVFSSPSTFNYLKEILGKDMAKIHNTVLAAIGPITRNAVEAGGYFIEIMPREHTFEGLAQDIMQMYKLHHLPL